MDDRCASRLALLGHPLRVGVLRLLVRYLPRPLGAGEIAVALGVAPSTLSAHLAALTGARLLSMRKEGPARLYLAAPGALEEAMDWLARDVVLGRAGGDGDWRAGPLRILFLDDDNAALSQVAEAVARRAGRGQWLALSAGLAPAGALEPLCAGMLAAWRHEAESFVPKGTDAIPAAEVVIALTERAAEALPAVAGAPVCAFWPSGDIPEGPRLIPRAAALYGVYRRLDVRIRALRRLPLRDLPREAVQAALDDLSSGLPAGGHAAGSVPGPRRRWSCHAPPASAAS